MRMGVGGLYLKSAENIKVSLIVPRRDFILRISKWAIIILNYKIC